MKKLYALTYVLLISNVVACAYAIYDTVPTINFHKADGGFSNWAYLARVYVITWPALSIAALVCSDRHSLVVGANLLNVGMVGVGLYAIGYIFFTDAYYPIAALLVSPFVLLSLSNMYALRKERAKELHALPVAK